MSTNESDGSIELRSIAAVTESNPSISQMEEVNRFTERELDALKIVYPGMHNSTVLNIFRELRTQLLKLKKKENFVCMVSTASYRGNASFVTLNLASVFALDKAKTSLIIDTNLHAPHAQNIIFGQAEKGITDYLSDSSLNIKDIVYATSIPRLRAVPLGTNSEGAAEYFESEKMLSFIDELRTRYSDRYIFIDAPPVASSSEARILAGLVDMVVLVVNHGSVTEEQIQTSIDVVGKERIAGLIYNN